MASGFTSSLGFTAESNLKGAAQDLAGESKMTGADMVEKGKQLFEQGQLSEARQILENALKQDAESAEGHYWLSRVLLAKKDLKRGLAELERSVELAPARHHE